MRRSASIRLPEPEQGPIPPIYLHDHGIAQPCVHVMVEEHDPAVGVSSFAAGGPGYVDGLVAGEADGVTLAKDGDGDGGCFVVEDPAMAAGRIVRAAQSKEENGAERNPRGVEPEKAATHARYHTQP